MIDQFQSNPWTYFAVANICILLGLSMLDVFTLPIPHFLSTSRSPRKKGFVGSFLLSGASGIILGLCTVPILGALLGYIASKENVVYDK